MYEQTEQLHHYLIIGKVLLIHILSIGYNLVELGYIQVRQVNGDYFSMYLYQSPTRCLSIKIWFHFATGLDNAGKSSIGCPTLGPENTIMPNNISFFIIFNEYNYIFGN